MIDTIDKILSIIIIVYFKLQTFWYVLEIFDNLPVFKASLAEKKFLFL